MDMFELKWMIIKTVVVLVCLLQVVPIMGWIERRGMALMQNRLGPDRVGPLGLFQLLADAVKFILKEDRAPDNVHGFYYALAPIIAVIPAFMTFAVIPFASSIMIDGREVVFQVANLNVGILYIFSIASLGIYAIMMAGWSSNSKYALFGSVRASSQMISYELSLGLSIVGVLMIFQSVELGEIVRGQGAELIRIGSFSIPKWGIFVQPIAFITFLTATYAETNRTPFDLPEGESEIVAGYHLEYGAMRFALFMMAEYINMTTACGMVISLFLGGWQLLPGMGTLLNSFGLTGMNYEWTRVGFEALSFFLKYAFLMWLYVWVRWTVPRFRYDQLMDLGWKVMLPLSLINIFVTAILIYNGVL